MDEAKKKKRYSKSEALAAMQRYCVYQDRCHSEVRSKLLEHQVYGDDLEEVISELITEGFLDEERFARSYVRGKHYMKLWGRIKIRMHLKSKKILPYCIKKGMEEIDEDDYLDNLRKVLIKKRKVTKGTGYPLRKKLYQHAAQKGYESHLINEVIAEVLAE